MSYPRTEKMLSDLCFVRENELIILERTDTELEIRSVELNAPCKIFSRGEYYQLTHLLYWKNREDTFNLLGKALVDIVERIEEDENTATLIEQQLPTLAKFHDRIYLVTDKGIIAISGEDQVFHREALVTNCHPEAFVLTRLSRGIKHGDTLEDYILAANKFGIFSEVTSYRTIVKGEESDRIRLSRFEV